METEVFDKPLTIRETAYQGNLIYDQIFIDYQNIRRF